MRRLQIVVIASFAAIGCGGSQTTDSGTTGEDATSGGGGTSGAEDQSSAGNDTGTGDDEGENGNEFQVGDSDDAGQAHGERPSQIEATETQTAMRLFVVNREDNQPIRGIIVKMTGPDGAMYYTAETDGLGYGEVLVPAGRRYEMEYLTLGRRNVMAAVDVPNRPNQDLRLTMRYRRIDPDIHLVLDGVVFETDRAVLQSESYPRLDRVVEFMRMKTRARIRITGHTDNVGNPRHNLRLSRQRAESVRDYLVSQGVQANRMEADGRGDQDPVATNDTPEGRQQNRRITATEIE